MNPITIAHLSDIHYNPRDNSNISTMLREREILVEKRLPVCLENLKIRKPDVLLITGDLTHEGCADDYAYLKKQIGTALPGVPVLCSMGNHDRRSAFRSGFLGEGEAAPDGPYYASMVAKGYRFISLDSSWEKGMEGTFPEDALTYLREKLDGPGVCGNILIMHHPVMTMAGHLSFSMTDAFQEILQSGKITAIFNGHVHGCYTGTVCGVPQFTSDSLKTGSDLNGGRISYNDRSGYQIVTFYESGDWLVERFLLHPETELFFERDFY